MAIFFKKHTMMNKKSPSSEDLNAVHDYPESNIISERKIIKNMMHFSLLLSQLTTAIVLISFFSCRDNISINDILGDYSLTLVDSLDAFVVCMIILNYFEKPTN